MGDFYFMIFEKLFQFLAVGFPYLYSFPTSLIFLFIHTSDSSGTIESFFKFFYIEYYCIEEAVGFYFDYYHEDESNQIENDNKDFHIIER